MTTWCTCPLHDHRRIQWIFLRGMSLNTAVACKYIFQGYTTWCAWPWSTQYHIIFFFVFRGVSVLPLITSVSSKYFFQGCPSIPQCPVIISSRSIQQGVYGLSSNTTVSCNCIFQGCTAGCAWPRSLEYCFFISSWHVLRGVSSLITAVSSNNFFQKCTDLHHHCIRYLFLP